MSKKIPFCTLFFKENKQGKLKKISERNGSKSELNEIGMFEGTFNPGILEAETDEIIVRG